MAVKAAVSKGATPDSGDKSNLADILTQLVGQEGVRSDLASREFYSQDIWKIADDVVELVVSPTSLDQVSAVVSAATKAGYAIAPRGAGMSYTSAYLPVSAKTVSLDLSRMNRVLEIRREDMTVTVEAGCPWSVLNAALEPLGLRTPFWGPMSGLTSTVGGGLSQLNAMLGAGHYGTSSESVVGLAVVLADGRVLRTGARVTGRDDPFYRHYGPDLAGLFCGDSGVFGIKAEITLRLMSRPAFEGYASFSFETGETMLSALGEMARQGVASETCGFDPGLTRVRLKRASLATDVKVLGSVIGKQKSLWKGLVSAAQVVFGGRNFIDDGDYSVHIIAEGRSQAAVDADLANARKIAKDFNGREIGNTIAKVIRAYPFPPLNSMIGPEGERWAPVHGHMALSKAPVAFTALQALFKEYEAAFEKEGIYTGYLFTTLSTNAITLEPVFYWNATRQPLIDASVEPEHLARLPKEVKNNPAATALVTEVRQKVIKVFNEIGCAHFQIGRAYPYKASRDEASWALIEAIKANLDPTGAINPGALGLTGGVAEK